MVGPSASVCSTGPPVSVCGTGGHAVTSAFSGRAKGRGSLSRFPPWPPLTHGGLDPVRGASGDRAVQIPDPPLARVGASLEPACPAQECLPAVLIGYAFRPPLRPRLTLGGRAFPRKPRAFGAGVSRPRRATRASILTSMRSTRPRRLALRRAWKAPLPMRTYVLHPAASAPRLAP